MFFNSVEEAKNYFRQITIDLNQLNIDEKVIQKLKKISEKTFFEDECSFLHFLSVIMGNKPLQENLFIEILQKIIEYDKQIYINYLDYVKLVCILPCLKTKKLYHMDFLVYSLNEKYIKLSKKIIEWDIYDPNCIVKEIEIPQEYFKNDIQYKNTFKNIINNNDLDDDDFDKISEIFIGESPLIASSVLGDISIVEKLLNKGANPGLTDSNERTALMYACSSGNFQIATKLLETNMSLPDKIDNEKRSAFYFSIYNHNENFCLKLMKEYNIIPNVYPDFSTALLDASRKKFNEIAFELLNNQEFKNNDYINKPDDNDHTAFDFAIMKNNKDLCLKIIESGFLLSDHQLTKDQSTSLILAMKKNWEDICINLIQNRIKNGLYCSFEERSRYCQCEDCQKTILVSKDSEGKNVEFIDLTLNLEFKYACKFKMFNLANTILNIENRRNMCDPHKDTDFAIEYCIQNNWDELVKKLLVDPTHFDVVTKINTNKKTLLEVLFENNKVQLFDIIVFIIGQKFDFYLKKKYEQLHEKEKLTHDTLNSRDFKDLLDKLKKICSKNKSKQNLFFEKINICINIIKNYEEYKFNEIINSINADDINKKSKKSKKNNNKNKKNQSIQFKKNNEEVKIDDLNIIENELKEVEVDELNIIENELNKEVQIDDLNLIENELKEVKIDDLNIIENELKEVKVDELNIIENELKEEVQIDELKNNVIENELKEEVQIDELKNNVIENELKENYEEVIPYSNDKAIISLEYYIKKRCDSICEHIQFLEKIKYNDEKNINIKYVEKIQNYLYNTQMNLKMVFNF